MQGRSELLSLLNGQLERLATLFLRAPLQEALMHSMLTGASLANGWRHLPVEHILTKAVEELLALSLTLQVERNIKDCLCHYI